MKRVIIESPFSAPTPEGIERNKRYFRACLRDSLMRGEAPFASHAIYTQPGVLDDKQPDERQRGIHAGFAWRKVANVTAVYKDLGITHGMRLGIEDAETRISYGEDHELVYRTLPNFEALMADYYDVDLEGPSGNTQTIYRVPVGTLEDWREQGMRTHIGIMKVTQAVPSIFPIGQAGGVKE